MTTDAAEQFARTARAYLTSATHARGEDLLAIVGRVRELRPHVAIDVGTNVGHTLRAIAPFAGLAVGCDPAGPALRLGREATEAANAAFVEGDVRALPFADGCAGVVTCRLAAHHFPDPPRAFAELARVLAPDGLLLLSDNYSPDDPALDRWIDRLERLRDASHARSETRAGWLALMRGAGIEAEQVGDYRTVLRTEEWLARSETPPADAELVRAMLRDASPEVRSVFAVVDAGTAADGTPVLGGFAVPKGLFAGRRR